MTMEVYSPHRATSKSCSYNLFKNARPCFGVRGNVVQGQIPQWINGNVLYNSPAGIYDHRNMTARHWFDGMGIMSSFKINGRNVYFTKKFLKSDAFKDAMRSGRITWPEHGTPASQMNRSHDFSNELNCSDKQDFDFGSGQNYDMCNAYMRDQCYRNDFGYNRDCDYNFGGGYCNIFRNSINYQGCYNNEYNNYYDRRNYRDNQNCDNFDNRGYQDCRSGNYQDNQYCGNDDYQYGDYKKPCGFNCKCKNKFNQGFNRESYNYSSLSPRNCMATFKKFSDNCTDSFYKFGNTVLATSDSGFERIVNPVTLETDGLVDMSRFSSIKTSMPLKDYNGDVYNLATSMASGVNYHFIRFSNQHDGRICRTGESSASANMSVISTIPSKWNNHASYNHSFGMTDNYLIMCEQPWTYNTRKLCNMDRNHMSYRDCMEWRSSDRNQFHIVNKRTGQRKNFRYMSNTPFYFRNFINCYETNQFIVVDMIVYDTPEIVDQMYLENLRNDSFNLTSKSKAYRFVLPLEMRGDNVDLCNGMWKGAAAYCQEDVITVTPYRISDYDGLEQPKINPHFKYRKYNYFYGVSWMQGFDSSSRNSKCISKVDVCTGRTQAWCGNEYSHPSEIVFVPSPRSNSEDDGVLISCISDSRSNNRDYMVFIDARNMNEIARVTFDEKIPFGNHTYFFQMRGTDEYCNYNQY